VIAYAFFTWFFAFTVPYIYNVDSGNLGARTGFVFMGTSICLVIGSWILVPNTAGNDDRGGGLDVYTSDSCEEV
jgi:hypothetical protein